jgi:HEPN domain-containing protein
MKSIAREWLRFADIDLKTAAEILEDKYLTPSVAFHCHQCIEKCFKAIISEYADVPPKIHNLLKLLDLAKTQFPTIDISDDALSYINETYIDARYPNDLGLLPNGAPSQEMAQRFYETTASIYQKVSAFLLL